MLALHGEYWRERILILINVTFFSHHPPLNFVILTFCHFVFPRLLPFSPSSSFLPPPGQVLGVDPPRPLPPAAYDLQTALESVQHFATQTLAGVVQAEATRGSADFSDPTPSSGGRSPRQAGGAGGRAAIAKAAAKETREAAVAAGLVEGWEEAWPPRELTKELGLVTARQMGHAMRCDAEPLIQVCMTVSW